MQIILDANGNPILDQFSEEGFVDLVFRIHDLFEADGYYRFHMAASYDEQPLGVNVEVRKGIGPGFDNDMKLIPEHVYHHGVRFHRSGHESDRLIATIAKLYGLEVKPEQMVATESFTAIALHQGDKDMESEPVKIKIFGNDGPEDNEENYYESFFNLDLKHGFVFWNEKDQEYRQALVRSLGGLG